MTLAPSSVAPSLEFTTARSPLNEGVGVRLPFTFAFRNRSAVGEGERGERGFVFDGSEKALNIVVLTIRTAPFHFNHLLFEAM